MKSLKERGKVVAAGRYWEGWSLDGYLFNWSKTEETGACLNDDGKD